MKKSECLCITCMNWVNCGWKNGKPLGFCICEDLYTYTNKSVNEDCLNYTEGQSISLKEWENENDPRFA